MNLDTFTKYKEKLESIKSLCDRTEGALLQIQQEMKKKFGCESLEQAQEIIDRIKKENEEFKTKYNTLLSEFESKWTDKLSEMYD